MRLTTTDSERATIDTATNLAIEKALRAVSSGAVVGGTSGVYVFCAATSEACSGCRGWTKNLKLRSSVVSGAVIDAAVSNNYSVWLHGFELARAASKFVADFDGFKSVSDRLASLEVGVTKGVVVAVFVAVHLPGGDEYGHAAFGISGGAL